MSQTSNETAQPEAATQTEKSPNIEVASDTLPAQDPKQAKVELDIEDAPFLKEEEPQTESKEAGGEGEVTEQNGGDSKKRKRKKLIIIACAALLLLVVGAAAAFFLLKAPSQPPPPVVVEEVKPEVVVVPSKQKPAVSPDISKNFESFIVPVGDTLATTNFLICKFTVVTKNPGLESEIDSKMIQLRDAVYFYLRSKSYEYLLEPNNAAVIKKDLVAILNDYLTSGKLDDVLLDTYLGR